MCPDLSPAKTWKTWVGVNFLRSIEKSDEFWNVTFEQVFFFLCTYTI